MVTCKKAHGYLRLKERIWLKTTAASFENPTIINIGVQYGASVICLLEESPDANLLAIDIDLSNYDGPSYPTAQMVKGRSQDQAIVDNAPIADLIFIDGSHYGKDVLADATLWGEKVKANGIIAFHDCLGKPGIHRIINQAVSTWYENVKDCWIELESVVSMRIFKRLP